MMECPLLTQSRHADGRSECLLSEAEISLKVGRILSQIANQASHQSRLCTNGLRRIDVRSKSGPTRHHIQRREIADVKIGCIRQLPLPGSNKRPPGYRR